MNHLPEAFRYFRAAPQPSPQQSFFQELQIPTFIKENRYLAASVGLALLRGPKTLTLGAVTALFFRLVSNNTFPSQSKPLVDRFLTIVQPFIDQPLAVVDAVAFCALMMFDGPAPVTTWWMGLHAGLLVLPKSHRT